MLLPHRCTIACDLRPSAVLRLALNATVRVCGQERGLAQRTLISQIAMQFSWLLGFPFRSRSFAINLWFYLAQSVRLPDFVRPEIRSARLLSCGPIHRLTPSGNFSGDLSLNARTFLTHKGRDYSITLFNYHELMY